MTLVWLSPDLPADRAELATALPPDFTVLPLGPVRDSGEAFSPDYAPAAIGALPVGSLCVATVFETELLASLAHRPPGVRLLVVGPQGQEPPALIPGGRPADLVAPASSVGELVDAMQQTFALPWTEPVDLVAAAPPAAAGVPAPRRAKLRTTFVAVGAILVALGIGGIVIASTEGSSNASPSAAAFPGGGNFGGGQGGTGGQGGFGGPAGPGTGTGTGVGGRFGQELLACLRQQGVTSTPNQLRQNAADPALRRAFLTCMQQLNGGAGASSQFPARP